MGHEQAEVRKIDLPHSGDLLDLRLPRALNAWAAFKDSHQPQLASIGSLQPSEVAVLSTELSVAVSNAIGMGPSRMDIPHTNPGKLVQLKKELAGEGNRAIFMRHGEQSPPEWIHSIDDPRVRKIRMMQDPFNQDDLLTNRGLVQVFVTAFGLLHVTQATGRDLKVLSSENRRAREVAEVITTIVPGATLEIDEGLSSITYKDERDEPPLTVESILEEAPTGSMPWIFEKVDKICKPTKDGRSQSGVIRATMGALVEKGTQKEGNDLLLVLTHSQQLAEVLRLTGKLQDPNIRVPELSMFVVKNGAEVTTMHKGVVADEVVPKAYDMRKVLEQEGAGYEWYRIRREEYKTDQQIPFLVSQKPLYLARTEGAEVKRIGQDVVGFMQAAEELYDREEAVQAVLNKGKPDLFKEAGKPRYLFVRPDLIVTEGGFSVCEIETSPFGLGLSELLNRAYISAGFETMIEGGKLGGFIKANTPDRGSIVYSGKTSSYTGQLQFLAKEVFSGEGRSWDAREVFDVLGEQGRDLYRGFYSYELFEDMFVHKLTNELLLGGRAEKITPSLTPHMEEKALMSLIWDKRWEGFLRGQLGNASFDHLREVVPPTWVVGQEQFFAPGLPRGISSSEGLAGLPKSKRGYVLKKSGFGAGSSWAEGVAFLRDGSRKANEALLASASEDTQSLYVVQEFRSPLERAMSYGKDKSAGEMQARLRITPYFAMTGAEIGELLAIKATGCENTNYIHASTGSINTAVSAG